MLLRHLTLLMRPSLPQLAPTLLLVHLFAGQVSAELPSAGRLTLLSAQPAASGQSTGGNPPEATAEPGAAALPARAAIPAASDDLTICGIEIRAGDIFNLDNPEENNTLFRLANRFHIKTREAVILQQLLFRPGDRYDSRLLEESERILRSYRFLYDAQIFPVRVDGSCVDLLVITRDVWTLTAGIGLSRSGGVNTTRFELQDTNFLGYGKDLNLEREDSVDRTVNMILYRDPALLGSRIQLELGYADNSDGGFELLKVRRPFYSLDSRWAAGLVADREDRVDPLYSLGEVSDRFRHQRLFYEIEGGLSKGRQGRFAHRLLFGMTFDEHRFDRALGEPPPTVLPANRRLVYPWIGYESIEDAYIEASDLDQIRRTEDLYLGTTYYARLGFSPEAFGSDRDRAIFDAGLETSWTGDEGQVLQLSAAGSGRYGGGFENLIVSARARYYWRNWGKHLFFIGAAADWTDNLDVENQLLLGGDSGLRGYPLRYQDGEARMLVTLEQRFYTDRHWFKLFYLGAAVFFDAGRTFQPVERSDTPQLGWLKDIGIGLRLTNSRSGRGSMIHFDLALPLDGDPSIEKVQWLISTKESF